MSDLQCPVTVLLSSPGEAEQGTDQLTGAGGGLTLLGRQQAHELGRSLVGARVSAIYCSGMARAVQTAEIVAAQLGVTVRVRDGLGEIVDGESSAGIRNRVRAELEDIADLHRGETVLVVSHTGAIGASLPAMLGLGEQLAASHDLAHRALVEVAGDADGWVLRSCNGELSDDGRSS